MEWTTSTRILERLRASGTGAAWDRCLGWFRTAVVSLARSMGLRAADAEDVAQETLLTFAQRFREGGYDRSRGRLRKWLLGIAVRQVRNARRRIARREIAVRWREGTSFWSVLPDKTSGPASGGEEWQLALLQQCLDRVRLEVESATFQAFKMVVYDERTPAETAAALGTTVKAVYNAKHRILKRVRELSEVYGNVPVRKANDGLP